MKLFNIFSLNFLAVCLILIFFNSLLGMRRHSTGGIKDQTDLLEELRAKLSKKKKDVPVRRGSLSDKPAEPTDLELNLAKYDKYKKIYNSTLLEQLKAMRTGKKDDAIQAAANLLKEFRGCLSDENLLYKFVAAFINQKVIMDKILEKKQQDPLRIYSINFLNELLLPREVRKSYDDSIISKILTSNKTKYHGSSAFIKDILLPILTKGLAAKFKKLPDDLFSVDNFSILKEGYDAALTKELGKKWIIFNKDIYSSKIKDSVDKLIKLFYTIKKYNILPVWINTIFVKKMEKVEIAKSSVQTTIIPEVQDILNEFNNDFENLDDLLKEKDVFLKNFDLDKFQQDILLKSDPQGFNKNIISFLISDEFFQNLKLSNTSLLSREIALSLMRKVVDLFTSAINFEIQNKTEHSAKKVKVILKMYILLLEKWASEVRIETKNNIIINNIIPEILNRGIDSENYENQFLNSEKFDPEITAIWRNLETNGFEPETLFDAFIFIRKNLIYTISKLGAESGVLSKINLPEWVNNITKRIGQFVENIEAEKEKEKLIEGGLEEEELESIHPSTKNFNYKFIDNNIVLSVDLNMDSLSASFYVTYNKASDELLFESIFYGKNINNRFGRISDFIEPMRLLFSLNLNKSFMNEASVGFRFNFLGKNDKKRFKSFDLVFDFVKKCLDFNDQDIFDFFIGKAEDKSLIYSIIISLSLPLKSTPEVDIGLQQQELRTTSEDITRASKAYQRKNRINSLFLIAVEKISVIDAKKLSKPLEQIFSQLSDINSRYFKNSFDFYSKSLSRAKDKAQLLQFFVRNIYPSNILKVWPKSLKFGFEAALNIFNSDFEFGKDVGPALLNYLVKNKLEDPKTIGQIRGRSGNELSRVYTKISSILKDEKYKKLIDVAAPILKEQFLKELGKR